MSKLLINVEGNIGVGKSTFTKILKEQVADSDIVYEPIDIWLNIKDNDNKTILDKFYEDKHRWTYTFQNFAYITRMIKIEDMIRSSDKTHIFLDRSLDTDLFVFGKMLADDGYMNNMELQIYEHWNKFYYQYVRQNNNQKTIYLRSDPEVCLERIKGRGRNAEQLIGLDYLKRLHEYHDKWLLNKPNTLIIDCNKDFENDQEYQKYIIDQVNKFI